MLLPHTGCYMQYLVPGVRYDWGPSKGIQIVDLGLMPVIKRTMILIEYRVQFYLLFMAGFIEISNTVRWRHPGTTSTEA